MRKYIGKCNPDAQGVHLCRDLLPRCKDSHFKRNTGTAATFFSHLTALNTSLAFFHHINSATMALARAARRYFFRYATMPYPPSSATHQLMLRQTAVHIAKGIIATTLQGISMPAPHHDFRVQHTNPKAKQASIGALETKIQARKHKSPYFFSIFGTSSRLIFGHIKKKEVSQSPSKPCFAFHFSPYC